MEFLPLTDILQLMTENFVDEDCRKQCFDLASRINRTGEGPKKYDFMKFAILVFRGSVAQFIHPFLSWWLQNSRKGQETETG